MTTIAAGYHPSRVAVMFASARLHARSILVDPTSMMLGFVQPVVITAIALMARGSGVSVDTGRIVLGAGLLSLWATTLWSSGLILQYEIWDGTIEALLTSPAGLFWVMLGKILGATATYCALIGASVAGMSLVLRAQIQVASPLTFLVALIATLISMTALGGLVGCLFVMTRAAIRIAEALTYPLFIVGGLLIPLTLLPDWARGVAYVMGPYWGRRLMTASTAGAEFAWLDWSMLGVVTAGYTALALLLFRKVLDKARKAGTLGHH